MPTFYFGDWAAVAVLLKATPFRLDTIILFIVNVKILISADFNRDLKKERLHEISDMAIYTFKIHVLLSEECIRHFLLWNGFVWFSKRFI